MCGLNTVSNEVKFLWKHVTQYTLLVERKPPAELKHLSGYENSKDE
jgi:hypothetical protein